MKTKSSNYQVLDNVKQNQNWRDKSENSSMLALQSDLIKFKQATESNLRSYWVHLK